jgi:RNA polymerase sigma-70 factor (ECF subfamily)
MGGSAAVEQLPGAADAEFVEKARAGDHQAFRVLVERYQGRVYGLALRVLRNEDAARDAVQDGFLKAYGSLDRFEGRSSFYTWLYRIVMNQCLDRKRRDRSDREVEWNDEVATGLEEHGAMAATAPDDAAERSELREVLGRAIAELPEDARRTIQLREIDGLSYKEISAALGIPKGTVMSRLHYARRRLQQALRAAGVDPLAEGGTAEETA